MEQINKTVTNCITVAMRGWVWNQCLWRASQTRCYWANMIGAAVAYYGNQWRCSVLGESPAAAILSTTNPTCTKFRALTSQLTLWPSADVIARWSRRLMFLTKINSTRCISDMFGIFGGLVPCERGTCTSREYCDQSGGQSAGYCFEPHMSARGVCCSCK